MIWWYLVSFTRYSDLLVENQEIFIPHLYSAPPAGVGGWPRRNFVKMFDAGIKLEWLGNRLVKQEAQLSQRGRAMPCVVDYFRLSLKAALSRRINMVTFANVGSVRLASLKFIWPSRLEDTAHLVCQLSIYNSFPVIRTIIAKNRHFHAKRCINEKTIQRLPNPSQHVPIYPQ